MIYLTPPTNFNPIRQATGCFITHKKEFLYLKNGKKEKYTGLWGTVRIIN
jgi:hypothetical protein